MELSNRGTKLRCGHCGAPFYDLGRSPVVCPKCHRDYVPPPVAPSRGNKGRAAAPVVAPFPEPEAPEVFEEDEVMPAEDDEEAEEGEPDEGEEER